MTVADMHLFFDLICDKVGSDYFTPSQKDVFLNTSMDSVGNDYFYNIKKKAQIEAVPPYGFEMSQLVSEVFWPVIEEIHINTNSSGEISLEDVNELISNSSFQHLINVAVVSSCGDDFVPCRFIRHNDFFRQLRNAFKEPTETYPVFRYISNKIRINPIGSRAAILTIIRRPERISLDGEVNCELPEFLHNEILFRATTYTGLSIREQDLYSVSEKIRSQNG